MLFDESQCFQIECFTKTCLDILKSQNIVIFDQGLAKILKFTPACQAEALRLVRQCCVVTRESVKAEFPHFDIIIAFKAFRLSDGCLATSIDKSAALQRLCQLWEVDFDKTLGEFQMLFRVAQVQQKQTGCSNKEAWQWALRRALSTRWPVENVEKAAGTTISFPTRYGSLMFVYLL